MHPPPFTRGIQEGEMLGKLFCLKTDRGKGSKKEVEV